MAIKWYVIQNRNTTHTLPTEDVIEHTTKTPCWCQPTWDSGSDHMMHNNFIPDTEGEGEEPNDGKYH